MLIEELRKEVYRLMQEAFKEEGIEFAHRNVAVYLPPETNQTASEKQNEEKAEVSDSSAKKLIEAGGAAAAIAAVQADGGSKKPKT